MCPLRSLAVSVAERTASVPWQRRQSAHEARAADGSQGSSCPSTSPKSYDPPGRGTVSGSPSWAGIRGDELGASRVVMPDVEQHGYRAYPLVDHVADKACAIFERHGTAGTLSLRCRDLVDLVAIVLAAPVEADPQLTALRSEAQRRGLQLPGCFAVPDRGLWQSGYAAEAGRSLLPMARTLDEAIAMVTPFLDPLLAGTARGRWDPQNARWTA